MIIGYSQNRKTAITKQAVSQLERLASLPEDLRGVLPLVEEIENEFGGDFE